MEPKSNQVLLNSVYGINLNDFLQEDSVYGNLQKYILEHMGEKFEEEFARFSMGGDKGIHMIKK